MLEDISLAWLYRGKEFWTWP